jgi:hypothetical protein
VEYSNKENSPRVVPRDEPLRVITFTDRHIKLWGEFISAPWEKPPSVNLRKNILRQKMAEKKAASEW